jgi:ABC-type glutathione transport system ATPase component
MLQYLVVRALGRLGALVIHASMAIVDGEALVFVGHSGAGKSTIARIAEMAGARIPTDDRTILTFEDGSVRAWGSPWYGSLVRKTPEGAPVRHVFLLQQAKADRIDPLPPAQAVKELFARLVQPRLDAGEVESALARLEELVQTVPVSILRFLPTEAAFELAQRAAAAD